MPTSYVKMCEDYAEAPTWANICAAIFAWLTLAGFVVIPGAFTSFSQSEMIGETVSGRLFQHVIARAPILYVAIALCILGSSGTAWLWWARRGNYLWVSRHIFQ